MSSNQSFTDRSNARRAAKRLIASGKAPSETFEINPVEAGGFIITWTGIATPDEAPIIAHAKPKSWLVRSTLAPETPKPAETADQPAAFDHGRFASELAQKMSEIAAAGEADAAPPAKRQRRSRPATKPARAGMRLGRRLGASKYAADAAAVDAGQLPAKPQISSPSNPSYQKKVDALAALAEAGDWDAVRDYPISQSNATYPRVVRRYHEQLLAARAAQQGA